MPDTELENYVKKVISEQTTQTTDKKDLVNDGHDHNFQLEDLVKHQASCSCPDCPYCKSMRERIETVKDDNLISNTINRAKEIINSKLSEKKKFSESDLIKQLKEHELFLKQFQVYVKSALESGDKPKNIMKGIEYYFNDIVRKNK